MSYFKYLPQITYFNRIAPDILTRVRLSTDFIKNRALYHPYTIEDGDRPDTIAHLYYGDSEFDWLVMLANNIYDYYSQWPLTQTQFQNYLTLKYGNVVSTYTTIDHYTLTTNSNISATQYNALGTFQQRYWTFNYTLNMYQFINASYTTTVAGYATLDSSEQIYWLPVTVYDAEFQNNEAKRNIYLIDVQYSNQLDNVLRNIMSK